MLHLKWPKKEVTGFGKPGTLGTAIRSNVGLTLVEILISVVIVAVLASLLLTGISKMQQHARANQCTQNLRAYATAALAFSADNDGRVLQPENQAGAWYYVLVPYLGRENGPPLSLLRCPTFTKKNGNPPEWTAATGYAMNMFFTSASGLPGAQWLEDFNNPVRLAKIESPSRTPMIWDNDSYVDSSAIGGYAFNGGGPWYYWIYKAHGNGFNVLFFDGHIERVAFNESGPFEGHGAGDYPRFDWAPHAAAPYSKLPDAN